MPSQPRCPLQIHRGAVALSSRPWRCPAGCRCQPPSPRSPRCPAPRDPAAPRVWLSQPVQHDPPQADAASRRPTPARQRGSPPGRFAQPRADDGNAGPEKRGAKGRPNVAERWRYRSSLRSSRPTQEPGADGGDPHERRQKQADGQWWVGGSQGANEIEGAGNEPDRHQPARCVITPSDG
jgi:hypothetical protein